MAEKNGFYCANYLNDGSQNTEAGMSNIDYLCKTCAHRHSCKIGIAGGALAGIFSLFNTGRADND